MKHLTLALTLLLAMFLACDSDDNSTTPTTGTGTLNVLLVDAPAAYDEVNIVFDSIQVHVAVGAGVDSWITIERQSRTIDLLTLVNGANDLLGTAALPAGHYSQIRLFIGTGSIIIVDGIGHPLTIPSGVVSGLKLNVNVDIVEGATYTLTLDFDAARSIMTTGNPNNPTYILQPTIRTVVTATTGSISGTLSPATTEATLWAYGVDTCTTKSDTTGFFKIMYLTPAAYSVVIMPADTLYRDTTISGVTVTAGGTLNLGTITVPHL